MGGARAVALLLAVIWGSSLPLLPWKLPLVPAALDRTYGIIAANRHRLPGDTPWCIEHPESCEPQSGD